MFIFNKNKLLLLAYLQLNYTPNIYMYTYLLHHLPMSNFIDVS